jgi:hypothetical protein
VAEKCQSKTTNPTSCTSVRDARRTKVELENELQKCQENRSRSAESGDMDFKIR